MHSFELSDLDEESRDNTHGISHLLSLYTKLVRHDPVTFRALETLLRSVSYVTTARFSHEISEMFFMSASLLQYVNDHILAAKPQTFDDEDIEQLETDKTKLEQMLHVLKCVEVFIELAARRIGGNRLRWVFVFIIAAVKFSIRLCLVYKHNRVLIGNIGSQAADVPAGWMGPRTGLVFKRTHPKSYIPPHVPNRDMILAELCYAIRPIVHLTSLAFFKYKSWVPYTLSLVLELFSLKTLCKIAHPTDRQTLELTQRKQSLVLYLFRSPCYDHISERYLLSGLQYLDKIPLVGFLTDGLVEYMPDWQKIYYYVWGN